jgi:hypothetical protein
MGVDGSFVVGRSQLDGFPGSLGTGERTINDQRFLTRLRLRSLKVYDHDRLEGLSFSVTEVRPIAPLLYS